jgi:hypothetical protein
VNRFDRHPAMKRRRSFEVLDEPTVFRVHAMGGQALERGSPGVPACFVGLGERC